MTQYTFPIVGAHFRPPAKLLCAIIPAGTSLWLIREADNPYDANAIKVTVLGEDLPSELLAHDTWIEPLKATVGELLDGYGFTKEELLEQEWHLGYIPRTEAVNLAPIMDGQGLGLPGDEESYLEGKASFTANGALAVTFDLSPDSEA